MWIRRLKCGGNLRFPPNPPPLFWFLEVRASPSLASLDSPSLATFFSPRFARPRKRRLALQSHARFARINASFASLIRLILRGYAPSLVATLLDSSPRSLRSLFLFRRFAPHSIRRFAPHSIRRFAPHSIRRFAPHSIRRFAPFLFRGLRPLSRFARFTPSSSLRSSSNFK